MKLRWEGHSCFLIDDTVVTDPYHEGLGFDLPSIRAKVVTLSHNHFDHNAAEVIKGHPLVLSGDVDCEAAGVKFRTVATYHDEVHGQKRGQNRVFVIETKDAVVCHMGDVGEPCTPAIAKAIGKVDVLLVPVGGTYTVDALGAKAYVDALSPRWVVPMHYRTEDCTLDIATVDGFIRLFPTQSVVSVKGNEITLRAEAGATQVVLFA